MRTFLFGVLFFWAATWGLILQNDAQRERDTGRIANDGRTEVVFWHAMSGPLGKVMDRLTDRYNASQKNYFIKSTCMGSYDTLQKKLLASIVAGQAPDISQNYESVTRKFANYGKIVCIDDMLASEAEDIRADIIPVLLANNTFDGKLWSFPFNKSVPVLYYNKDLFKQAGIDPEQPPKTWDDMASYAARLTKRDEQGRTTVYGFGSGKGNVWMYLCRVLAFGGRIMDDGFTKSYMHEEPAIKALKAMQDMLKAGTAYEGQGFDPQNDFKSQRVAMIDQSIVSKVHMETGSGLSFPYGIAPLPGAATHAVILSGSNINIFKNGNPEKIKGAWDFVKWFTSTEVGAEWARDTTYLPVRKSSIDHKILQDRLVQDPNLKAPFESLAYAQFEPRIFCWFEIRDMMADHLERATLRSRSKFRDLADWLGLANLLTRLGFERYLPVPVADLPEPGPHLLNMSKDIDGILRHSTK